MTKLLFIFICLLLIAGCSSTKINVKYDKQADYNRFETYGWLKSNKQVDNFNRIENLKLESLVQGAIDSMMSIRGYELLNEGDPDMLITYYAGVTGKIRIDEAGYSYGNWFDGEDEIEQSGILLIDIIDNESMKLFWRGKGSGLVDDPESAGEAVIKISEKIFDKFPERYRE